MMSDIFFVLQWWLIFFFIGILFFPFTASVFSHFTDKGYIFSKVIGIVLISYIIFFLGILHLLPFSTLSVLAIASIVSIAFFLIKKTHRTVYKTHWKYILVEECLFLLTLGFWSFIRIHQPDIHGLEKYMDFGFVNTILRSDYFPPTDMWFTPYSINYYYFGHFMTAVLTKLSGIPSFISYNLMMATLFAFTFTLSYSFILNCIFLLRHEQKQQSPNNKTKIFLFLATIVSASLVALGGNLHILYIFFSPYTNETPVPFSQLSLALETIPNAYWYPNATRFIFNTIHEFPIYSFVVSDLHGHVLSIPIILTIICLLLQLFISKKITIIYLIFIGFFISCAYMTNAWDGAIYLLLTLLVLFSLQFQQNFPNKIKGFWNTLKTIFFKSSFIINYLYYSMLLIASFFLFSLPFSLFFQTSALVRGIGILCAPEILTKLQQIGPFIFEADHCQKSPVWQLLILYGFFYFFIVSFFIFLSRVRKITQTDIFILLMTLVSTLLILIPEFIYIKDIYPAHYRANTMFKLTYEAFIMLSLVSGYVIIRIFLSISQCKTILGKISIAFFILITSILVSLVLFYPSFAITAYYENLKTPKSLDGTAYLKQLHPDDYDAIQWINNKITKQPIIAEAQGDSYTDFARISTNTGLPTILGWTVHEWLWRGSYDIPSPRITEIQTLYETPDKATAQRLLQKYAVSYIYIGSLEKQKYPKLSEEKFKTLGKQVYKKGETTIYKVTGY